MDDLIRDAAGVLIPYLGAEADDALDAVAANMSHAAAQALKRVVERLRARLSGRSDRPAVQAALDGEMQTGDITRQDLEHVVNEVRAGRDVYNVKAHTSLINSEIRSGSGGVTFN